MLQKQTVTPGTLELIGQLMRDEVLKDFFLVGGTALSLQIGHRESIDIDLFTREEFDQGKLTLYLEQRYNLNSKVQRTNTLIGEIKGVKVDLITHAYPLVKELLVFEDIRMASKEDIAAMKLNAIVGNGTRMKDFVDVAYLSSDLSFGKMMQAFGSKYGKLNPVICSKALVYHDEINFGESVKMLRGNFQWKNIRKRLIDMVKNPMMKFPPLHGIQGKSKNWK